MGSEMYESNSDILFLKKELELFPVTLQLLYEDASGVEFEIGTTKLL